METFSPLFDTCHWDEIKQQVLLKTPNDVEQALNSKHPGIDDFMALVSPAAENYLEPMAQLGHSITQKRFGKTIQLYIPLYLSNVCYNSCVYCGFNHKNKIERKTLSLDEIHRECRAIEKMGFDNVLLVTGEASDMAGFEYLKNALSIARLYFSSISMEVQPLETGEYRDLIGEGLHSVYVYQETYHKDNYKTYHPAGKKSDFYYRLDTPDRLGMAGIHRIGIGFLIGLEDWRTESVFSALHLGYLEKKYWRTRYSISFPRLRPAKGIFNPNVIMSDKELIQLITAYRIYNNEVELSLSTRENTLFRDHAIKLGITAISAGSRTNPGGYAVDQGTLEQFEVSDNRSPVEIANILRLQGYDAVWKDWDKTFIQ